MNKLLQIKETIGLIDLTTLSEDDTQEKVKKLCESASYKIARCAAVCVYPQFVSYAKSYLKELANKTTTVATVVNFPSGDLPIKDVVEEITYAINQGADEIDAVIPYKKLKEGDTEAVANYIEIVRKACGDKVLKIIIESGELTKDEIKTACVLCIKYHVDFIKTSTGKTSVGATQEAVETILKQIFLHSSDCGLKVSGGVKTFEDAMLYSELFKKYLPKSEFSSLKFRIGASSLLQTLIERYSNIS